MASEVLLTHGIIVAYKRMMGDANGAALATNPGAAADSPHGQFSVKADFDAVALAHLIPEDGFERAIFLHVAVQLANEKVLAVDVHPPVPKLDFIHLVNGQRQYTVRGVIYGKSFWRSGRNRDMQKAPP